MTAAEAAAIATAVQTAPVLEPFSKDAMACCSALSRALLRDPQARRYPDLMALGFWLREAQLSALQAEFRAFETPVHRLFPRGTIFQIAPANVDTLFAYMWSLALLTGNRSIVRLSSRSSPQAELLLDTIGRILAGYARVAEGNRFVRYVHDAGLTAQFSLACDLRVVWGGDETVNTVRRLPLPPHARDLVFPDRYSFCAVKAAAYLATNTAGRDRVAHDFCNDVLWFDQMACSSPRTVLWCGEECDCESAADDFLHRATPKRNAALPVTTVRLSACRSSCSPAAWHVTTRPWGTVRPQTVSRYCVCATFLNSPANIVAGGCSGSTTFDPCRILLPRWSGRTRPSPGLVLLRKNYMTSQRP